MCNRIATLIFPVLLCYSSSSAIHRNLLAYSQAARGDISRYARAAPDLKHTRADSSIYNIRQTNMERDVTDPVCVG